jgi:hypothetical protein
MASPGPASSASVNTQPITGSFNSSGILLQLVGPGGSAVNLPYAISQSATAVSLTGSVAETSMLSITIPASIMGINGSLRLSTVWSTTNNVNNKTITTKFGGTTASTAVLASCATYREQRQISNRGSLSSQVTSTGAAGGWGVSSSAIVTLTKDTSIDQILSVTGTLANAGDTMTLESYVLEVIPS